MEGRLLQIGEVADRLALSLRTVRYYEEMGLLVPEKRTEGGFRLFSEAQIERLLVIKQMKPLGFTVQEMRELLRARDVVRADAADADERDAARETIKAFAADAAERCQALRRKLEDAEGFAAQLRREARRPRDADEAPARAARLD